MKKTTNATPFVATHTLLAGWGYDDLQAGFARFMRAETDTPVRIAADEHAKAHCAIVYTEQGERRHADKRGLRALPVAPVELIPGHAYACGCAVQTPEQAWCKTHGPGIVVAYSLYRVSYTEHGRAEATGHGRDRAERERALAKFRLTGRAWLQESKDNGRTWRSIDC